MILKTLLVLAFIASIIAVLAVFFNSQGTAFCSGVIFAIVLYQCAYKVTHGEWINF